MADSYTVDFDFNGQSSTDLDDQGFVTVSTSVPFVVTLSNVDGSENETTVRQALQANGQLPREGQSRPGSFIDRCVAVTLSRETPLLYRGSVTYAAPPRPQENGEDQNINPWDLPAKIVSVRSIKTEEPIDEDADGDPIRNPQTDEPVEGITRPVTDTVMVIRKSLLTYNLFAATQYNDGVNDATVVIGGAQFPAGVLKVEDVNATLAQSNDTDYWTIEVTVIARKAYNVPDAEAWYHRRALKGFYEVKGGKVVRAVDDENQPVTTPVYLDATTGERKAVGDPPDFVTTKKFTSFNFNELGIF